MAAAEQLYGAGTGADKLAYVCDYIESKGYTVDRESIRSDIRAAIEAAVYELGNSPRALPAIEFTSEGSHCSDGACNIH